MKKLELLRASSAKTAASGRSTKVSERMSDRASSRVKSSCLFL